MAQLAVRGPFSKPDLPDELRRKPVNAAHPRHILDRGRGTLDWRHPLSQLAQHAVVVARANLPGVLEMPIVVVPHEQCPESLARTLWVGEADDDEFLLVDALELEPVAAAPGDVARID